MYRARKQTTDVKQILTDQIPLNRDNSYKLYRLHFNAALSPHCSNGFCYINPFVARSLQKPVKFLWRCFNIKGPLTRTLISNPPSALILERCDSRPCRIQSPNYPGVYPRNITCYYRIEHRQVPRGKHALLAVRQRNSHKVHIKDQVVKYDRSQRVLR
ncbi:unnamed protein product [Nezara viridula]|uniref:CUB domain-containing protein n=1 Tax=Nezara viridula TaxID=85310 RepID=A0A9P0MNJ9_NEZVI|nr:unnamed protein product [Nezara viridula]